MGLIEFCEQSICHINFRKEHFIYRLIRKLCQIQLRDKFSGRKERKVEHIQRAINYQVLKYVRGKPGAMGKLSHYSGATGAAVHHLSAPSKRAPEF
jgi:hypothetical protein